GEIRQLHDAPIVVTIDEDRPVDVASYFEAGADDCIRKPFHPSEFAARIEAIARRSHPPAAEPVRSERNRALPEVQGLVLDTVNKRAYCNGMDLGCSHLEFQILH